MSFPSRGGKDENFLLPLCYGPNVYAPSMDRGVWQATVYGVTRVGHDLATKAPPPKFMSHSPNPQCGGVWRWKLREVIGF